MSHTERCTEILQAADHCVKCGLCLPHCPTYALAQEEPEGPRGRISLLQGLALGELEPDAALVRHLDNCLGCRACEAACPARVEYARLLDLGRAEIAERRPRKRRTGRTLGLHLLAHPQWLRRVSWLAFLYQRLGVQRLVRATGLLPRRLQRLEAILPRRLSAPRRLKPEHRPQGQARGRVALFAGCLGQAFDRRTVEAAIRLLTRIGYQVDLPAGQTCCGALAAHGGDPAAAAQLAQANLAAFTGDDYDHIVYLASGCGAQLSEYRQLLSRRGDPWGGRLIELSRLLADADWPAELRPAPLPARVAVHMPCTQRNVLGDTGAASALLARIPQLEVVPLPGNERCCGAAGEYMLTRPDAAAQLRAPKLAATRELRADYLVTSNIGCALHLAAGFAAPAPEVLHPAELLARQL